MIFLSTLLFYLSFITSLILLIGLIYPPIVLFWGSKVNRTKVVLFYGSITVTLVILALLISTISSYIKHRPKTTKYNSEQINWFKGTIIYSIKCEGTNQEEIDHFKLYNPQRLKVSFRDNQFRIEEEGGYSGILISNAKQRTSFYLVPKEKSWSTMKFISIDDEFDSNPRLKELVPYSYAPKIEETKETEMICGYKTKKCKVIRSGFVRPSATCWIWVTTELNLPSVRVDCHNSLRKFNPPVPLSLGLKGGTILRAVITENNVKVAYEVISVIKKLPQDNLFSIPGDYKKALNYYTEEP